MLSPIYAVELNLLVKKKRMHILVYFQPAILKSGSSVSQQLQRRGGAAGNGCTTEAMDGVIALFFYSHCWMHSPFPWLTWDHVTRPKLPENA